MGSHKKLPFCISKRVGKLSHFISSYTVDRFGLFSSTVGLIPRRHRRLNRPPRAVGLLLGGECRQVGHPLTWSSARGLASWPRRSLDTREARCLRPFEPGAQGSEGGARSPKWEIREHVREHVSPILRVHVVRHVAVTKVEKSFNVIRPQVSLNRNDNPTGCLCACKWTKGDVSLQPGERA